MNKDQAIAKGVEIEETKHSMLRRMEEHDYRGKSIYMLTLVTTDREPSLGVLRWPTGKTEEAYVEPTQLGLLVERCWEEIPEHYPEVRVLALQLMPDHLHGLLFVTKEQEAHLGHVVKGFKIGCTHARWALEGLFCSPNYNSGHQTGGNQTKGNQTKGNQTGGNQKGGHQTKGNPTGGNQTKGNQTRRPVFAQGYQDSVLTGKGQLERMFAYIADNPRRLAVKRLNPERFRIQELLIAGRRCQIIGNRPLLNIPDKRAVIVHRRYTDEENARLRAEWLACGERGGVLVSAAIAPKEKAVLREAMDRGYRIILLRENGFPPLYKPSGEAFDACSEGRLLQISPWEFHMERETITREQCLELNAIASEIAGEK